MRQLFSTKVKVILVVAVLLTAGLTILSSVTGQTIPSLVTQALLSPLKAGANALTQQADRKSTRLNSSH